MPNRIAFTQLAVEKLKPPATGRATYWDKNVTPASGCAFLRALARQPRGPAGPGS